nr:PREDICTED: B-cell antigen receptor complex-associated protein alpha chain [Paralichthys olivaceus]
MGIAAIVVLCSFAVGITQSQVTLNADNPFQSVPLSSKADLECCYAAPEKSLKSYWVKSFQGANKNRGPQDVGLSDNVTAWDTTKDGMRCSTLTLKSVRLSDTGLYQCLLSNSQVKVFSRGTYLIVYKPLKKTLNISESSKNKILIAEGILLFLCVLLPSASLLFKSNNLHKLEKKKAMREEENIYQGLNLEDCCSTYDQIERSQAHGPYQDVCNFMEEEEEIQLEKP